jgi:nicotinamide phosphoribosyltransferase
VDNLILLTDSYKVSHWKQYPPKTTNVYSYFESRGGLYDEVIFFGLQYFLKRYLWEQTIRMDLTQAQYLLDSHLGPNIFNVDGWRLLFKKCAYHLPVHIKAVPEGMPVSTGNVLMTIENTDPDFYWLTNYLETLLVQVWYPCTVATISRAIKKDILRFLKETGDESLIDFKLHDFGFRGVSSVESAGIGGLAHLVNFKGTDTIAALVYGKTYYDSENIGFSIPAAEHSTITSWGKDHEVDAFRNMLTRYPTGLVACVSDSYDIFKACSDLWGGVLKDAVLARDGCLVVRPDSGKLPETIIEVINRLGSCFGYETNKKGYMVLNPKVRIIQGDGVNQQSINLILSALKNKGWSADNIAFGMGGALLQRLDRDTQSFAFKCSNVTVNGEDREVSKSPVTDPTKNSKAGKLKLVVVNTVNGPQYRTVQQNVGFEEDLLVDVFKNGAILKEYTLNECRVNTTKTI